MKLIQYVPRFARHAAVIGAVALVSHGMPSYAGIRIASHAPIKTYHQLETQQSLNSVYVVLPVQKTEPTPLPTPAETAKEIPPKGTPDRNAGIATQPEKYDDVVVTFYYCKQVPGYPAGDGGGYCGRFANGEKVTPDVSGTVAAAIDKYPLGSVLQIKNPDGTSRNVRVVDRGELEQNGITIDVFFYTNKEGQESEVPKNRDGKVKVKR